MSDEGLNVEINGIPLRAAKGAMIIQVADQAGIQVPRFCYHKKLSVAANCRMCLVDVEKMPKPVPACATPVMEGMKVQTRSQRALDAQRGVMEFLLINHPLDCPICDEGGECELQDTALGFGKVDSVYEEDKRVVANKNLGPLITTEMTRCIHCTRCVRFGKEIGGIMELGGTGRGEHMEIGTYVESSVESELSGNMIDLCPVGALTSKPYRFTARSWELQRTPAVAPHDCIGSNIEVHHVGGRVKRVLPRENETINEIWLSDRDRYSYVALNGQDRLRQPLLKAGEDWRPVSWQEALERLAGHLRDAAPEHVGGLLSPSMTLEEFYLAQKLFRGLGSDNIDHRLRQVDFNGQESLPLYPAIPSIEGLEKADAVLLVGSNLRKDQPLLNTRIMKAVKRGARVWSLASYHYEFNYPLAGQQALDPATLVLELAALHKALSVEPPPGMVTGDYERIAVTELHSSLARELAESAKGVILLGDQAVGSPYFSLLRRLAIGIAERAGLQFLETSFGANGAGAWLAGAVPHRGPGGNAVAVPGKTAAQLGSEASAVLLLAGVEPEGDFHNSAAIADAMKQSAFTVALSCFDSAALREGADLLLPVAAFSETSGTYVNCEGRQQSFQGAVPPPGEARPAWKVFRVLGNLLELSGFEYASSTEVLRELNGHLEQVAPDFPVNSSAFTLPETPHPQLVRIGDVTLYGADPVVRRSTPLQHRSDCPALVAAVNASEAEKRGLRQGDRVRLTLQGRSRELPVNIDPRVADGCCYLPITIAGLGPFGAAYAALEIEAV